MSWSLRAFRIPFVRIEAEPAHSATGLGYSSVPGERLLIHVFLFTRRSASRSVRVPMSGPTDPPDRVDVWQTPTTESTDAQNVMRFGHHNIGRLLFIPRDGNTAL